MRSRVLVVLGLAVVFLLVVPFAAEAACECGKERWAVKVGTDADAGQIHLGSVSRTTVAEMRGWQAPGESPDDRRLAPHETTVYVVDAVLVSFKREKDCDYHLVLRGPSGETLIAEIPDPPCVGTGSPLAAGVAQARGQFDAAYTAGSSWKSVSRPVRVTGVAFFDRIHGQSGVAPNGIELHPVLSIEFDPAPMPEVSAAVPGTEQLVDGGFEATPPGGGGTSAWTISPSGGEANYISATGKYPHGGKRYAYLGGKNGLDSRLSQTVSLPASLRSAVLSLWVNVVTSEDLDEEGFDFLTVEIQDQAGGVLATPVNVQNHDALTSNNAPGIYFQPKTVDLSPYRGQTIRVVFHVRTDESYPTSFRIDDVSLQVAP